MLGGLGGLLSFVLRRSLEESPEFARMKQLASRQPFREVLRAPPRARRPWAFSVLAATAGFNGLFFAHMAAYMSGVLHYDPRQAVSLADHRRHRPCARHSRRSAASRTACRRGTLLRAGALALAGAGVSVLRALADRTRESDAAAGAGGRCAASFVNGTFAVLLTDLFPTRVRFSGVALGFNVAFTIFSGTAPLVATSLIRSSGLETAPAFIMVACGLLTLAGSLALPKASGYVLAPLRAVLTSRSHEGTKTRSKSPKVLCAFTKAQTRSNSTKGFFLRAFVSSWSLVFVS